MTRHSDVKPRLASGDERPTVIGTPLLVVRVTRDVVRVSRWSNPRLGKSPGGLDRQRTNGRKRAARARTAGRNR